jgi:predicted MPP superfamily phosphohydrolase
VPRTPAGRVGRAIGYPWEVRVARIVGPAAGAAAACVAYGVVEARLYRKRRHVIPCLPAGAAPVRVLQVSDTHMHASNRRLAAFLASLGDEEYDLVVATGDMLGTPDSVEPLAEALNGLNAVSARLFVLGSSDYYVPRLRNYFNYFRPPGFRRRRRRRNRNRTEDFRRLLTGSGWTELTNRTIEIKLGTMRTQVTGLDDPHVFRDDRTLLVRDPNADFAVCLVHDPAPYDDAARAGYDLVISGHTHGGQVRFPVVGAVVTNSTVPRELARWAARVGDAGDTWMFVSPGLGTSRFAPFRFLCPPEASILELVPRG